MLCFLSMEMMTVMLCLNTDRGRKGSKGNSAVKSRTTSSFEPRVAASGSGISRRYIKPR